jgi:chromosome partitioning protein parB / adenine-specific methyltransferase|nr:MAG TPA: adenine specific DNA methyltransferase [Caudoviricetes sp.]
MNIIEKPINEVIPYEKNPRINDNAVPAVMKSIEEFGFKVPIVIDKNGTIVTGHTRLKAAKKLGMKTVPCIVADDLTPEQIKAFRLADNKVAEAAEWDMELLNEELDGIIDIDMSDFNFGDITDSPSSEDVVEDDGENIELPRETKTRLGDIWVIGRHKLMCGDATSEDVLKRLMGGDKADMYLTDPPYNVAYEGKTEDKLTIQNDSMEDSAFYQFLVDSFVAADSVMNEGAAFYVWHADSEGYNFRGACRAVEWELRECLIWNKNTMVLGRQDYQWKHEPCLYGWKGGAAHNWYSDRKQTTVIDMNKPNRNAEHPTMKPVQLFAYLMENSSKPGDIILDSFCGSGTTLIACEQMGRVARVLELDPKYCDVIIKRYINLVGSSDGVAVERNGEMIKYADL